MRTIQTEAKAGRDGMVTVTLPLGVPDAEYELVVVVQPRTGADVWPEGYFRLFGSIEDESFERPPQGDLPPPVALP